MTEEAAAFTVPGGKYTVLEILRDLPYGFSSRKQRFLWQEHWGARPVTADYSELYRTLQSKEADAAENSIVNYYAQAFYEVAPYFTEDNHTRSADVLVMSLESRKKLSEGDLLILDKTAEESCEYQRKLWAEEEAAVREALLQKNAVITQLTDSEYEAFRQVCEQIWYSYRDGRYIDLIDRIVAVGYLQKLPEQEGEIYESGSE